MVNLMGECCDKVLSISCRKMVRRVGRVLVLTVGLPALTPTLLLKAVGATLATNIGGINYCITYNFRHLQGPHTERVLFL
jgi:hypothetical protein